MYIRAKIKEHYGFISLEPSANLNLSNSTLTFVGLQNGSHRKATRGSCDIQQTSSCLRLPPLSF